MFLIRFYLHPTAFLSSLHALRLSERQFLYLSLIRVYKKRADRHKAHLLSFTKQLQQLTKNALM